MEATLDVVRLVHYAASMAAFGASLFRLAAGAGPSDLRLRVIVSRASVAALLSAGLWLLLEAGDMAGDWAYCVNRGTIETVLGQTLFGEVWRWRLGLGVVLVIAARWRDWWPTMILSGLFLASLGDEGHSAWLGGRAGALHLAGQALHLLAAGTWLGGLVALRLRLRAAPSDLAARRDVTLFSRLGYLAVALVLATGALNTAILVQDGGLLVVTSWTVVLAAKLCLVTVLLGLAVTNRVGITRSWQPSRLAGRVAIELAVGLLVLLAASILGRLPPPQP